MVYSIINEHALCYYYNLNENPGVAQRIKVRKDKFAFLDDASIAAKLVSFRNDEQVHIKFYLPQIHCSSCLYLLENLHRLTKGVISAKVDFTHKEAPIVLHEKTHSLRPVDEQLAQIGYATYISVSDLNGTRHTFNKRNSLNSIRKFMSFPCSRHSLTVSHPSISMIPSLSCLSQSYLC